MLKIHVTKLQSAQHGFDIFIFNIRVQIFHIREIPIYLLWRYVKNYPRYLIKKRWFFGIDRYLQYFIKFYSSMLKIYVKKEKKPIKSKTEPDEPHFDIRQSLGDDAKEKLREMSYISNNLVVSRSRDWTLDEPEQTTNIYPLRKKCLDINSRQTKQRKRQFKLGLKLKDVDRFRRLNRTQESMRGDGEETERKTCNSINMNFETVSKEKEVRIHSNGQLNIQFGNSTINLTQKALMETATKLHNQFSNTHYLFHSKNAKKDLQRLQNKKAVLPYRKLAVKSNFETNYQDFIKPKTSDIPNIRTQLAKKKQFLDLSLFLMEERKSIFCPMKISLSTKERAKSRGIS